MKSIKRYILNKLGISELREKVDSSQKELQELEKRSKFLEYSMGDPKNSTEKRLSELTIEQANIRRWVEGVRPLIRKINRLEKESNMMRDHKDELMQRVLNLEKVILMQDRGLNQERRTSKIVVSLTSFPARIETTSAVIEQMLYQTVRPDEIVLWLSKEQFPEREAQLPKRLIELRDKFGVRVGWCDGDLKAYKKFLSAFKEYSEDLVITIDDDLVYPIDLVEKLYDAHQKFPKAIIASRVHKIEVDEGGRPLSYKEWKKQIGDYVFEMKEDWFFTGGAGTLFPPHLFAEELFNEKIIQELCPLADDVWLNVHAAMNKAAIVNIAANNKLARIASTQEVCLQTVNLEQNENDAQLKNLTSYYRDQLKGTIYEKM